MIKELIHDPILLARKSEPAVAEDLPAVQDLLDTIAAHRQTCVGMAANMIGVCKRIIVFDEEGKYTVMLNPQIVKQTGEYEAEESCLSLLGGPRKTKRYQRSKCSTRMRDCRPDCGLLRAGQPRSSSMRSITVTES